MAKQFKPETLCVQAGWTPKKGEPRVLPIYQSTTFKYDTSEQMARLFDLEDSGYFYTRLQNPTNDAVAAKIAALEGGVAAMLTSSGQAANFYAIFNICQAGDHFVCSSTIYGGTFNLFGVTLKKLGIDVTFVNPDASEEEISAAFRPNTKALFGETISNPTLEVLDIEKFARIAHSHGVPLIVDNTFPTPINCRPFEWGADIVVHSTTKYMDGHATSVGGAIVDSGNFDWDAHADKFPGLCTPDESYHGLTYTKAFGKMAYITKATAQLMRDLGSIQSPQNAFLLNLGLETLHLRMPQHCKNAQAVAEYLAQNDKVAWVNYCGLPGDKYYEQAQKYMPNGSCGVVTFGLKGGREESIKFMDSLKLAAIVTHVADAYSIFERTYGPTNQFLNVYAANDLRIQPNQFFHWNYTNPDNGKTWTAPENACGCWFWYDEDALLNTGRSTKDRDIFRYAEALLDAAESIAQSQGVTAEAAGYLAQVKARANMEGKTVAAITADLQKLGKQAFIEECWTERLREFPLEFKIWDDCLRTGKFPVISSTEKGKVTYVDLVGAKNASGATFKSSDLLWPISLNEMQRNPSLTQNEGYAVQ